MKLTELLLATNNEHKIREIAAILAATGVRIRTRREFADFPEIEEHGATLEENALLKARTIFQRYQVPALADDTGLEVAYLNGAPGVYSARYAGEQCSFEDNNRKLLAELEGVPLEQRGAKFISVIAIAYFGGEVCHRGEVDGVIADSTRGSNGFGYDPVFYYPPLQKTYAQMSAAEKNAISHRARALVSLRNWLVAAPSA